MKDQVIQLRRSIITKRAALPPQIQRHASNIIYRKLLRSMLFIRAQRIAFYFSNRGEISTELILNQALAMAKECYLPILHPVKHNRLWFARYRQGDILKKNIYGILEPDLEQVEQIEPWSLDLVLTPLVAFDQEGNRIGMGGGYYDRTFAFKKNKLGHRPFLLGLAYDFQEIQSVGTQPWDVPLDAILTETKFLPFYKSPATHS